MQPRGHPWSVFGLQGYTIRLGTSAGAPGPSGQENASRFHQSSKPPHQSPFQSSSGLSPHLSLMLPGLKQVGGGLRGWRTRPETTVAPRGPVGRGSAPRGLSPSPLAPWRCAFPGIRHPSCPSGHQPRWLHFPSPFSPPPCSTQSLRSSFWTPRIPTLPSCLYPSISLILYF